MSNWYTREVISAVLIWNGHALAFRSQTFLSRFNMIFFGHAGVGSFSDFTPFEQTLNK